MIIIVKTNRTPWLDTALSRIKTRRILLPMNLPAEVSAHLKALVRRYRKTADGELASQYISTGPDHYAFSRVYSEIAFPLAVARLHNRDIRELL